MPLTQADIDRIAQEMGRQPRGLNAAKVDQIATSMGLTPLAERPMPEFMKPQVQAMKEGRILEYEGAKLDWMPEPFAFKAEPQEGFLAQQIREIREFTDEPKRLVPFAGALGEVSERKWAGKVGRDPYTGKPYRTRAEAAFAQTYGPSGERLGEDMLSVFEAPAITERLTPKAPYQELAESLAEGAVAVAPEAIGWGILGYAGTKMTEPFKSLARRVAAKSAGLKPPVRPKRFTVPESGQAEPMVLANLLKPEPKKAPTALAELLKPGEALTVEPKRVPKAGEPGATATAEVEAMMAEIDDALAVLRERPEVAPGVRGARFSMRREGVRAETPVHFESEVDELLHEFGVMGGTAKETAADRIAKLTGWSDKEIMANAVEVERLVNGGYDAFLEQGSTGRLVVPKTFEAKPPTKPLPAAGQVPAGTRPPPLRPGEALTVEPKAPKPKRVPKKKLKPAPPESVWPTEKAQGKSVVVEYAQTGKVHEGVVTSDTPKTLRYQVTKGEGIARGTDISLDKGTARVRVSLAEAAQPAKGAAEAYTPALAAELPGIALPQQAAEGIETAAWQITHSIGQALGLPIRKGRFQFPGATGIFKPWSRVIRVRSTEDLITVAHETGEAIRGLIFGNSPLKIGKQTFGRAPRKVLKGFASELEPLAGKMEPPLEQGWAQFVRLYLTNEAAAKQVAPKTFKFFENVLKQDQWADTLRPALLQFRNSAQAHAALSSEARIASRIVKEVPESTDPLGGWFQRFWGKWVDDLQPIRKLEAGVTGKEPMMLPGAYVRGRVFRGWRGRAEKFLKYGVEDDAGNTKTRGLQQIFKGLSDEELDSLMVHRIARNALERERLGKATGFDQADLQIVTRQRMPDKLEAVNKELTQFQDAMLDYASDFVGNTQAVKDAYRNHVPFWRLFVEKGSQGKYAPKGKLAKAVMKARGSERPILDPKETLVRNTYMMVHLVERNKTVGSIVDLANQKPGLGAYIENVPKIVKPIRVTLKELRQKMEDILGKGFEAYTEVGDELGREALQETAHIWRADLAASARGNTVVHFTKGEPAFYEIGSPALYDAIMNLDAKAAQILGGILSWPARLLRGGAILSPEFAMRNPIRDMTSAMVYSTYGARTPISTLRGLASAMKQDKAYQEWLGSGGAISAMVSVDRAYVQGYFKGATRRVRAVGKMKKVANAVTHPWETLQMFAEMSESANRIPEFHNALARLRKMGYAEEEARLMAAYASRDVTLDFMRAGTHGRTMNSVTAFWNAQVQGLDKMGRSFRQAPLETSIKATAWITLPSVVNYLGNRKNPDYWDRPQWERDLYWHFPIGKNNEGKTVFFKVPKPFELGLIFGTLPERFLHYIDTKDPEALDGWDFAKTLTKGGLPSWLPTALVPAIEWVTNWSYFFERPVVPKSLEDLEPGYQVKPSTSNLARVLAAVPNMVADRLSGYQPVSPIKIDNTIRGYTAGLGQHGVRAIDWIGDMLGVWEVPKRPARGTLASLPGIRGMISPDPGWAAEPIQDFYNALTRATQINARAADLEAMEDYTGAEAERATDVLGDEDVFSDLRSVQRTLAELRRESHAIWTDKSLSPARRQRELDRIATEAKREANSVLQTIRDERRRQ